jgi:dynein heavy chain
MWPERGLEKVADHFLQSMDIDGDIRGKCIALCKHFHMSAAIMCNRYDVNYIKYLNYIPIITFLYFQIQERSW